MRSWPIRLSLGYLSVLVVLRVAFSAVDRPEPQPLAAPPGPRLEQALRVLHGERPSPAPIPTPVAQRPQPTLEVALQRLLLSKPPPPGRWRAIEVGPNLYEVFIGDEPSGFPEPRIVPAFRDGRAIGFKLFGLRPKSFYAELGLQSGDIIISVNGLDLTSPEKALVIFSTLREAKQFDVELERAGARLRKTYVRASPTDRP